MSLRCCPEVQLTVSIKLSVPSCLSLLGALLRVDEQSGHRAASDIDPSVDQFTGLTTNMFPSCLFYLQTAAPADFLHGGVGHLWSRCWFRVATGNWRYRAEVITVTASGNFRGEKNKDEKAIVSFKKKFSWKWDLIWESWWCETGSLIRRKRHFTRWKPMRATWKLPVFNSHSYYVCVLPVESQRCACSSFTDGFKPSAALCYSHMMLLCPAGTFQLWGHSIQVDWAEPEKDVDEEVMQRVRVLYVRTHTNTHSYIFITFLYSLFVC